MTLWVARVVRAKLPTLLPVLETPGLRRAERVGSLWGAVAWVFVTVV